MLPANSYKEVIEKLRDAFKYRYQMREQNSLNEVRMVGLLFARPKSPFAAQTIIPNLDYFHTRSGNNIDFFLIGYGGYWTGQFEGYYDDVTTLNTGKMFSNAVFNSFRQQIEG